MVKEAITALILLVASCSGKLNSTEKSYYTAAVVEYSPVGNVSVQDSEQISMMNARNYVEYIKQAAILKVDIIVFPECGLTTFKPNEIRPSWIPVPDPNDHKNPCTDSLKGGVPEVLKTLSCAARNGSIYVVVNLPEVVPCNDTVCSFDKHYFYNSNVVFDRSGTVIARYRAHLNITWPSELTTFDTDFGVRFGTITSDDLLFYDPAVKMVHELGVRDIVYTTAWFSRPPFLTAIQYQEGWAYALDVNLLVSGYDDPGNFYGGSGIYIGRRGILNVTMPFTKTNQLLISRVPKNKSGRELTVPGNITHLPLEPENTSNYSSGMLTDDLTPYTTQLLEKNRTNITVCDREFCCEFNITADNISSGPDSTRYRLVAFSGIRVPETEKTEGIQGCSIIACSNSSLSSCVQPKNATNRSSIFKMISVQGNFNRINSLHMPNTLLDTLLPLNVSSYNWNNTNITDKLTRFHISTKQEISNLRAFGIYTRVFELDEMPSSGTDKATQFTSFIALGILVYLRNFMYC